MSYIMDTIRCPGCGKYMNVAFGIVGMTQVAAWPTECGFCKRKEKFEKVCGGWRADNDGGFMEKSVHDQVLEKDNGDGLLVRTEPDGKKETDQS